MSFLETVGRHMLMRMDAESAHNLTIKALKAGIVPAVKRSEDPRLRVKLAGLEFPNPVGVAAGFDKNAEVPDAMLQLGFGFTEVGTITPRPQAGNPKPRVFRLASHGGVINRLGFNNEGHDAALRRLEMRAGSSGIVGVNIGANKDSDDFVTDYVLGIERFAHVASYFTVNISSPNTPGLRNLQAGEALKRLIDAVFEARAKTRYTPPVFLKLAPDLETKEISQIASVIATSPLDAVMVSNTTLSRAGVEGRTNANEQGGLSGTPLFHRSTVMLARFREALPGTMPLIGIGGVRDAETTWAKLEAGASLVQLYTGMVYEGPRIAANICQGLLDRMAAEDITSLDVVTGRRASDWAGKALED